MRVFWEQFIYEHTISLRSNLRLVTFSHEMNISIGVIVGDYIVDIEKVGVLTNRID